MAKPNRMYRIADLIQIELAKLIQNELKDPRVGMVTLTGVEVSSDLAHAKIYFNVHDETHHKHDALNGLNHAAGFLRRRLASLIDLRNTPALHFHYDDTLTKARQIDKLLDDINTLDS
ncbi:MAG: 30S ribosome-binding factor RbfA [Pseudomonadota bacterium]